ncbi:MAG TPA: hypothetical protein VLZ28_07320, partial [Daejeonella sp.]|nr:hypothetical protein [Daejeonella sp.]
MRKPLLFIILSSVSFLSLAQQPSKKPLDHQVYDAWQSVNSQRISNDGLWVMYAATPQQGDANLSISNLKTKVVSKVQRVNTAEFSENSKYAVFLIKPFYQETRSAKIKKKKADDMPKDTLGIMALGQSPVTKVARVKSYKLPEKASNVVAYLMDKAPADTAKKKKAANNGNDFDFLADDDAPSSAAKTEGTDLVVYKLAAGTQTIFKYVTEYTLSNNGKILAFVSSGSKKDSVMKAGLFWYDIEKDQLKYISSGKGNYKNLTFDDTDQQFAFTAEKGPEKSIQKFFSLYYYTPLADSAKVIADKSTSGMPANWNVNSEGRVFFSKNSEKLFFGTSPIIASKDTNIVDFEVAKVDVWNYKDDYLQPMQLKNMERELKRSYMAVIYPKNNSSKILQLGSLEIPDIELGDEGNSEYALVSSDIESRKEIQWNGSTSRDLYLLSTVNGNRKKIASKVRGGANLSPGANYVIWYDRTDKNWYTYNVKTGASVTLNNGLDTKFYNELNDVPDDPNSYGIAMWTDNDQQVLIYDRYDIWSFNPAGGSPKSITNGYGRKNDITFRYIDFDAPRSFRRFSVDEKVISSKLPVMLSAFNNVTKESGWYTASLTAVKNPKRVTMSSHSYSKPLIAKNGDSFIYTKANYQSSPDLYVSNDFKQETKLSSINSQQSQYNWGTAELVKWTTPKGYQSEGILYKPEDFDTNKKYPMIV